jgi:hypothetical protein
LSSKKGQDGFAHQIDQGFENKLPLQFSSVDDADQGNVGVQPSIGAKTARDFAMHNGGTQTAFTIVVVLRHTGVMQEYQQARCYARKTYTLPISRPGGSNVSAANFRA